MTKQEYNKLKKELEAEGYYVKTKYRKGLKRIKLEDIEISTDNWDGDDWSRYWTYNLDPFLEPSNLTEKEQDETK